MDDELESWCMRWLAKGEKPEDLAKLLRHWAEIMDCRARAEYEMVKGIDRD